MYEKKLNVSVVVLIYSRSRDATKQRRFARKFGICESAYVRTANLGIVCENQRIGSYSRLLSCEKSAINQKIDANLTKTEHST